MLCNVLSCSVVSNSLWPMDYSSPGSSVCGESPGKNSGVGCHALLQGIFPGVSLSSRHRIQVSCIAGRFFTIWATSETNKLGPVMWLLRLPPCIPQLASLWLSVTPHLGSKLNTGILLPPLTVLWAEATKTWAIPKIKPSQCHMGFHLKSVFKYQTVTGRWALLSSRL